MIGMLASIERPEYFHKLIMIGPSPCYINDGDIYHGGIRKKGCPRITHYDGNELF